jgi:hypothetical protein
MAINYVTLYGNAIQPIYKEGLRTFDLERSQTTLGIQWMDNQTFKLAKIATTGFGNYDRTSLSNTPDGMNNDFQNFRIQHYRTKVVFVNPLDMDETNQILTIGNYTQRFNKQHKIPETDAHRLAKIYQGADSGNIILETTTAMSAANILAIWDELQRKLDDNEVPQEGRIAYVTPAVFALLKAAAGITRFLNIGNKSADVGIDRSVFELDEVRIIKTPAARMITDYTYVGTDGTGVGFAPNQAAFTGVDTLENYTSGASAASFQQNILMIHPEAVVAPRKLNMAILDAPSAENNGNFKWFEASGFEAFVIDELKNGIVGHRDTTVIT